MLNFFSSFKKIPWNTGVTTKDMWWPSKESFLHTGRTGSSSKLVFVLLWYGAKVKSKLTECDRRSIRSDCWINIPFEARCHRQVQHPYKGSAGLSQPRDEIAVRRLGVNLSYDYSYIFGVLKWDNWRTAWFDLACVVDSDIFDTSFLELNSFWIPSTLDFHLPRLELSLLWRAQKLYINHPPDPLQILRASQSINPKIHTSSN